MSDNRPDGEIDKNDEIRITAIAAELDKGEIDFTPGEAEDRTAEVAALFLARNTRLLPSGALTGIKIGVYQHSTVARDLMVQVLESYGATAMPLGRSGHFIPVDTEAVSPETIALLKGWPPNMGLMRSSLPMATATGRS